MLEQFSELSAALAQTLHDAASAHLLRDDGQEDLCFALWRPSKGKSRLTALVFELVLPEPDERRVHGNVSFYGAYLARALDLAIAKGVGVALMHSHITKGWQPLSTDDHRAEASNAGRVAGATGLPLLGITFGGDGACSGRFWRRHGDRQYTPMWCASVRVVGERLRVTSLPGDEIDRDERHERTQTVFGRTGHALVTKLRFGIIGLGSVGSLVNECLARIGARKLVHVDYDFIEARSCDRTIGANGKDVGRRKIDVANDVARNSSTASTLDVIGVQASIVEPEGFQAALDCDVLFSCVDSPWPRRVLNQVAYAHLVPVVDGGILARLRDDRFIGADWRAHTVGPDRRCLECLGAFDAALVGVEQAGLLEDPSYVRQMDARSPLLRNENVFPFSMNLASLEILQMIALCLGPVHDLGQQNYHYATGGMDRGHEDNCDDSCLYAGMLAAGHSARDPIGHDYRAERVRATLGRNAQVSDGAIHVTVAAALA